MIRWNRVSSALLVVVVLCGFGALVRAAAPIAAAGPDQNNVPIGSLVSLDGSGSSDPDGDPLTYAWKFLAKPAGSLAVLSVATSATPSFTADRNGVYTIQLTVKAAGETATDTVTVTTLNSPPVANAGADTAANIGKRVKLIGTASIDPDGDKLTFAWTLLAQPEASRASIATPTKSSISLLLDRPGTYVAQLQVTDPFGASDTDIVEVTHINSPPVSQGGLDQAVSLGAQVTLDARGSSDVDEDTLTYAWALKVPVGSGAVLSDATALQPTFFADVAGIYTATLTAHDGTIAGKEDKVLITTGALNAQPVAHAGADQRIVPGQTVHLDGGRSADANGQALTFAWTLKKPITSAAALANPTAVHPTFVPDVAGTYTASLTVTDTALKASVADSVVLTTLNVRPVADAGADRVATVGAPVRLRGSGSTDVDGQELGYGWALLNAPPGSTAPLTTDGVTPLETLPETATINPWFTPDVDGTYQFQLIVNDGVINSVADTMLVTTGNVRPQASAGLDQFVSAGDPVSLDGTASSDANGDPLTYAWAFVRRPAGSAATLSGAATAIPTFTADVNGVYVVQLRVSDGVLSSAPDNIVVTTGNAIPVADPGPDQEVAVGAVVSLTAAASSDADGDGLTYRWAILARPEGSAAVLSSTTGVSPTFTLDVAGTYVVQLIAHDGTVSSAPATVTIVEAAAPVITVVATDATATEGGDTGTFTFSRTGPTTAGLTVSFTRSGTATLGPDYTLSSAAGSVSFAAGSSTATSTLTALADAPVDPDETATLTLAAGASYVIGTPSAATVTILESAAGPPVITLAATDATATEGGDTGTYTFTRTGGSVAAALAVSYTWSGTATLNTDYTLAGQDFAGQVTFAAGATTKIVTLTATQDLPLDNGETATLTLVAGAGYTIGAPNAGTVTIADTAPPVITLTATDASATEGGDTGTYTFTRTGGNVAATLAVNYTWSGTATLNTDYTLDGQDFAGQVTFAGGATTKIVTLTAIADVPSDNGETAVLTLAAGPASGSGVYTIGSPNAGTVTIADNAPPVITITATDANATEGPSDTGTYTFTRTGGNVAATLAVNYTASGTATPSTDYTLDGPDFGGQITFAAGATTKIVTLTAIADVPSDNGETAILTLAAGPSSGSGVYTIGSPNAGTVTIADNAPPVITLAATDSTATEGPGDTGTYTFTRTGGNVAATLAVSYTVTGTATVNSDYTLAGQDFHGQITFAAGATTKTVTLTAIADVPSDNGETAILTLAAGPASGSGVYTIGSPNAGTVTIVDNAPPEITLTATDANAAEGPSDTGTYTFTRTGGNQAATLVVSYTVTGSATVNSDYTLGGQDFHGQITFAAGAATKTVTLTAIQDVPADNGETAILTLSAGPASGAGVYTIGAPNAATVTIADNAPPVITITATDANATEGPSDTGTYTFTRTGGNQAATLVVSYTVTGTATVNSDYSLAGQDFHGQITFAAGAATKTVTLTAIQDVPADNGETTILTLSAGPASGAGVYTIGAPNAGTVTIADNPPPVITITATDANATEGPSDTGTYTFTRTGGNQAAALVVSYTVTGTATVNTDYTLGGQDFHGQITFAAGSATKTVTLTAIQDVPADNGETTILTLSSGPASGAGVYAIGAPNAATVTIADNPPPVITIEATDANATEGPSDTGTYTFTRTGGNQAATLVVSYTVTGSATVNSDYTLGGQDFHGQITFAAGSATKTVTLTAIQDVPADNGETAILTLSNGPASGAGVYAIGAPNAATVTIADNPPPVITITATDANATEGGDTGTYTFTRTGGNQASTLVVSYTVTGSATVNSDYTLGGQDFHGQITFAAGSATKTVTLTALTDVPSDDGETAILTLSNGPAAGSGVYAIGAPNAGTVTIVNTP